MFERFLDSLNSRKIVHELCRFFHCNKDDLVFKLENLKYKYQKIKLNYEAIIHDYNTMRIHLNLEKFKELVTLCTGIKKLNGSNKVEVPDANRLKELANELNTLFKEREKE